MKKLPSERELSRLEKKARDRLIVLFKQTKLQGMESHLHIGLERIAENGAFARTFARYLRERGFTTVEEFANKVYLGDGHIEALDWLRFPIAFRFNDRKKSGYDRYILALSDLEWDPRMKQYYTINTLRLI